MKLSDLYFALANLFLAIEISFTFEHGWVIGLGFLLGGAIYHGFKGGVE